MTDEQRRREVRPRHCITHDCTTSPFNPERCQHIAAERDQSACRLVPLFYEVPDGGDQ